MTDDPLVDFDAYELEESKASEKFPICDCCGGRIYQETAVFMPRFKLWICDECLYHMRKDILD